eukprot:COSAG06_NODE_276_length_18571_cov_4.278421_9_plen_112_part_00
MACIGAMTHYLSACLSEQRCDLSARSQLSKNVVLAGGTTCFPAFAERLQDELTSVWDLSSSAGSSQSRWKVVRAAQIQLPVYPSRAAGKCRLLLLLLLVLLLSSRTAGGAS